MTLLGVLEGYGATVINVIFKGVWCFFNTADQINKIHLEYTGKDVEKDPGKRTKYTSAQNISTEARELERTSGQL